MQYYGKRFLDLSVTSAFMALFVMTKIASELQAHNTYMLVFMKTENQKKRVFKL